MTLTSLRARSEEVERSIAREGEGLEKLQGGGRLSIPAHLRPEEKSGEPDPGPTREERIATALARMKGKAAKPATGKTTEPTTPPDQPARPETASGLREAKRRAREKYRGDSQT